jgi:hypothetical protein
MQTFMLTQDIGPWPLGQYQTLAGCLSGIMVGGVDGGVGEGNRLASLPFPAASEDESWGCCSFSIL